MEPWIIYAGIILIALGIISICVGIGWYIAGRAVSNALDERSIATTEAQEKA